MHEVVLVIHLILAVAIVALVLIQRSSGGGLGIGGGGGGLGDFATARGAANVLTKATTICAFMFFATSLSLAYMAKGRGHSTGLLSNFPDTPGAAAPVTPGDATATPEAAAPAAAPATTPEPPVSTE